MRADAVGLARARHGDRVDVLLAGFSRADPLGDAVAELLDREPRRWAAFRDRVRGGGVAHPAIEAMIADMSAPRDFDPVRADRGADLERSWGLLSGILLRCYSLPASYRSPIGVLPLVQSRRLLDDVDRRLLETAGFVNEVARRGSLLPHGGGWRMCAFVRVMHAMSRRRCAPGWSPAHGVPISQPEMAATVLLFSALWVDGATRCGVTLSAFERDAVMHLWRRVGQLLGVEDGFLFDRWEGAMEAYAWLMSLEGHPGDDSRALTRALFRLPEPKNRREAALLRLFGPVYAATARELLGDDADALGVEAASRLYFRLFRAVAVRPRMRIGARIPQVHRALARVDERINLALIHVLGSLPTADEFGQ